MIETVTNMQTPIGCMNRKVIFLPWVQERLSLNQRWIRNLLDLCVWLWAPHQGGRHLEREWGVGGSLQGNELARQQSLGENEAGILWGEREAGRISYNLQESEEFLGTAG